MNNQTNNNNLEYMISDEWSFGDDNFADKLKDLVLSGKKTATTGLYKEGDTPNKVGNYGAILDGNGKRFCIIQYTKSEVKPFLEVNFEFIQKEGEGDVNIEEWREGHRKYFKKWYDEFSDDALVTCDEFKVVKVVI